MINKKRSVCVIGSSNNIFLHSYIKFFLMSGFKVSIIDTAYKENGLDMFNGDVNVYSFYAESIKKRIKRTIVNLIKISLKKLKLDGYGFIGKAIERSKIRTGSTYDRVSELRDFVFVNQPEVFFCFWSTAVRNQVGIVKKTIEDTSTRNAKFVLDVPTYPIRGDFKMDDENPFHLVDKLYFENFNLILFPSYISLNYFNSQGFILDNQESIVRRCGFPLSSYFFSRDKLEQDVNFKLVFLGHVDFNNRGQDDVCDQILEVTKIGIDIHTQTLRTNDKKRLTQDDYKGGLFEFEPFTYSQIFNGEFSKFISSFDGVIVLYNEVICSARTSMTYPTRFALACLSPVPIYVPKGIYISLEEVFGCDDGVFFYSSYIDLLVLLKKNRSDNVSYDRRNKLMNSLDFEL